MTSNAHIELFDEHPSPMSNCCSNVNSEFYHQCWRSKKRRNLMFIDVLIVVLLISINLFEKTQCTSIDLIRYHVNLYRCGEVIIDEDLIRPLYSYFISMKPEEHRNTNDLFPILHSLTRIETACRTAYLTSNDEMKSPSILYNGFKWLKSTFRF